MLGQMIDGTAVEPEGSKVAAAAGAAAPITVSAPASKSVVPSFFMETP